MNEEYPTSFLDARRSSPSVPLSAPAPATPSLPLSLPSLSSVTGGPAPAGGGLAGLLTGANAEAELVKGVLSHQLILNRRSMRAALFLYSAGLGDLMWTALELKKFHSRPGNLIKALDAVSLKDYMAELRVSVGNK